MIVLGMQRGTQAEGVTHTDTDTQTHIHRHRHTQTHTQQYKHNTKSY
jgi:hypothetical protein